MLSSSCCMQYQLWLSITQSVFGHHSRALVQGTSGVSTVPPSVTEKKSAHICWNDGVCFCYTEVTVPLHRGAIHQNVVEIVLHWYLTIKPKLHKLKTDLSGDFHTHNTLDFIQTHKHFKMLDKEQAHLNPEGDHTRLLLSTSFPALHLSLLSIHQSFLFSLSLSALGYSMIVKAKEHLWVLTSISLSTLWPTIISHTHTQWCVLYTHAHTILYQLVTELHFDW